MLLEIHEQHKGPNSKAAKHLEELRRHCEVRTVRLYGREVFILGNEAHFLNGLLEQRSDITVTKDGYVLANRSFRKELAADEHTVVNVGGVEIGSKGVKVAGGPCAVESEQQINEAAREVAKAGGDMLRGGAFKPRTNPYSFQGLGEEGLRLLRNAGDREGLPIVTELVAVGDIPAFKSHHVDMIQIGARNAQNFDLITRAAETGIPILLKHGFASTLPELLSAAEYALSVGNENVVLCMRGHRTGEEAAKGTRFTLDMDFLQDALVHTHLPVGADPSHAAGRRGLVSLHAMSAVHAGAQMLLVEVHPNPEKALSDPKQQLNPEEFGALMEVVRSR